MGDKFAMTRRARRLGAAIEDAYLAGVSAREVAERLSVTRNAVWRILRERGVPTRPRGNRLDEPMVRRPKSWSRCFVNLWLCRPLDTGAGR